MSWSRRTPGHRASRSAARTAANGVRALHVVLDEQLTSTAVFGSPVSGLVPNENDITPGDVENPVPVITTCVPP
jgi:hypothetical protein